MKGCPSGSAGFRGDISQMSYAYICASTAGVCLRAFVGVNERTSDWSVVFIQACIFWCSYPLLSAVCLPSHSLPIMLVIRHTWDTTKSLVTMTSNQDKAGHFCIFVPGVVVLFLYNFSCNGKSRVGLSLREVASYEEAFARIQVWLFASFA